jgi:ATP-dependent Lon protease
MSNSISINKYKIFHIQKDYICISKLIFRLHKHIVRMSYLNILDITSRNIYVNKIHNLIKILNTSYNNYILNTDDDIIIDLNNEFIFDDISNNAYENIRDITQLAKIFPFTPSSPIEHVMHELSIKSPLEDIKKNLEKIVRIIGMYSIIDILIFEFSNTFNLLFEEKERQFLDFISSLIIPISYELIQINYETMSNVLNNNIEITESMVQHDELFNQVLQIKIKTNTGNLIVINGFIKNDINNIIIKTSQICNRYIYDTKKNIDKFLSNQNISLKIKKIFMKYISIYDILIYNNHNNYIDYFNKFQKEFIEINNQSLQALMKIIGDKNITLTKLYKIIKYLLISDNDKIATASIIFEILKGKKIGNSIIVDLIYDNFDYNIQIKLKKGTIIIKDELEKISSLNIDDIDLKNQLLVTKCIPENIKSLINEKIDEIKNNNGDYYKQILYIKTLLKFPWNDYNNKENTLQECQDILNNIQNKLDINCYGHNDTKLFILKIVGKWLSNPNSSSNVLGLVGPPGIGKTLIAKSLGDALDLPFIQITLGGQNDGELLHGHGYTYNNAQPGIIIRKMAEIGKSRCIILFDELDKACSKNGIGNEITSILIHLTDPVMNKNFQDRFFQGIDFPMDKVILIFSYNDSSLIDPILLDRIQEIHVKPYTVQDKKHIIQNFIKPELCKMIGFDNANFIIPNETMEYIINKYTIEAGVRSLRRKIENIFLKLNIDRIYQTGLFNSNIEYPIIITIDMVNNILNKPNITNTIIHSKPEIGIINGLYATTSGIGGIVPIQIFANYNDDHNNVLRLTGSQGIVMKESVQCAFTTAVDYIVNNKYKYNIDDINNYLKEKFPYGFHIHCSDCSTPKDGPSASVAFACAFISRILGKKIKNDIGITGEISLTGHIHPIGSLLYKIIGGRNAGLKIIYIPKDNEKDYEDIKYKYYEMIEGVSIISVNHIDEIINEILI